jgi:hypothetical protein
VSVFRFLSDKYGKFDIACGIFLAKALPEITTPVDISTVVEGVRNQCGDFGAVLRLYLGSIIHESEHHPILI